MVRATLLLMSIVVAPMSWGDLGLDAWVDHQFGPISAWISGVVFSFAFSTMISWSYYGLKAWQILVGPARVKAQIFQIVFCVFIVLGSMVQLKSVVAFSDACLFILSVPNVIGLYFLGPQIRARLKRYRFA
jgi:alanine or glycine:cation symporter, AGCS family